jgi:Rieske Fe-S protein
LQVLENFLRERFDVKEVVYKWSAQNYRPADGIPYIGLSSGNKKTFIATGFAADGLTYGTLAAMIISGEIIGAENKWSKTYHAARNTPIASAGEFIKENVNVAAQYVKNIPGVADAKDYEDIKVGEGKVISKRGEKIAAYRDNNDKLHVCSAVCPHLGCIVSWNEMERSWDCPCHGSRFDCDGFVLEGPAIGDLNRKIVHQPD